MERKADQEQDHQVQIEGVAVEACERVNAEEAWQSPSWTKDMNTSHLDEFNFEEKQGGACCVAEMASQPTSQPGGWMQSSEVGQEMGHKVRIVACSEGAEGWRHSVLKRLSVEEDQRHSLPGSPRWTKDMNPSYQPDGAYSEKKQGALTTRLTKMVNQQTSRPSQIGDRHNPNAVPLEWTELEAEVHRKRLGHLKMLLSMVP